MSSEKKETGGKNDEKILDSNAVENQNKGHNIKKEILGPNTKR